MTDAHRVQMARRIWVAVPFKGPVGSKRRLSALLDEDERAALSLAMLHDVVEALLGVPTIERVLLLRPRGSVVGRIEHARLVLQDEFPTDGAPAVGDDNLNAALRQAQAAAV